MDYDVIVAGGGIGGAVLAELLGRAGKRALVLERETGPAALVRPEILWPATVRLLSRLIPEMRPEDGLVLPLTGVRIRGPAGILASLSSGDFDSAGARPASTDPARTRERLLRSDVFELRRGVEVTGALEESGRIVGVRVRNVASRKEEEFRARAVIGDDGPRSIVRQACGIELRSKIFPVDLLCFGFEWPRSLPGSVAHAWLGAGGVEGHAMGLLAMPLPGGRGAAVAPVRPGRAGNSPRPDPWGSLRPIDGAIGEILPGRTSPKGFVIVRRPWGHARRYGARGAFLIGDAAHPVSPAGGQGANMSIADGAALARILIARDAADGFSRALEEYERLRRPANSRSLRFTRAAAAGLTLGRWLPSATLPAGLRWLGRRPSLLRAALRFASTAYQDETFGSIHEPISRSG